MNSVGVSSGARELDRAERLLHARVRALDSKPRVSLGLQVCERPPERRSRPAPPHRNNRPDVYAARADDDEDCGRARAGAVRPPSRRRATAARRRGRLLLRGSARRCGDRRCRASRRRCPRIGNEERQSEEQEQADRSADDRSGLPGRRQRRPKPLEGLSRRLSPPSPASFSAEGVPAQTRSSNPTTSAPAAAESARTTPTGTSRRTSACAMVTWRLPAPQVTPAGSPTAVAAIARTSLRGSDRHG